MRIIQIIFGITILSCLLFLIACDKRENDNTDNWIQIEDFNYPVNISHFADFDSTDVEGNLMGHVSYGSGGDNNDWRVFEYHGKGNPIPEMITGLSMQDTNYSDYWDNSVIESGKHTTHDKGFDSHGFIYPGVPETIVPDSVYLNLPFIFKTPSLQEYPDTPIIEYSVFEGLPVELSKQVIYQYTFGANLHVSEANAHSTLKVTVPSEHWYALAYYNNQWHEANPYPKWGAGDIAWNDIVFSDTVKVIFCQNDPFIPPVDINFNTILTNGYYTKISWTWAFPYDIRGFNILRSETNTIQNANVINDSLITQYTYDGVYSRYSYYDKTTEIGKEYYYWLEKVNYGDSFEQFGPVFISIPVYNFPQGHTEGIIVYPAYPNSTYGLFNVKIELEDSTKITCIIFNQQYQVIRTYNFNNRMGQYTYSFDIGTQDYQPAGLYRMYFWFEKGNKRYYSYGDVLKR